MPALKKILCALDLSDQSESVAEYAVMLAKMSGASIVAVYAAPTLTQYTGFHVPPNTIDNFVGEIVSGAERDLPCADHPSYRRRLIDRGAVRRNRVASFSFPRTEPRRFVLLGVCPTFRAIR